MELRDFVILVLFYTCGFSWDVGASFCDGKNVPVLRVCRDNQTTVRDAYIYAPNVTTSTYCKCVLVANGTHTVTVSSTKGFGDSAKFTILDYVFIGTNATKQNITVTTTSLSIHFNKAASSKGASMCLRFLATEFKEFTITCFQDTSNKSTHPPSGTTPSSTGSVVSPTKRAPQRPATELDETVELGSSTMTVERPRKPPDDDERGPLNLGLIIGSIAAVVVVVTVAGIIILYRRNSRKKAKENTVRAAPQQTDDEPGHYFLEDNERYVSSDDCKQATPQAEQQRLLKSQHAEKDSDTYDKIDVENKSRQSNRTRTGEAVPKTSEEDQSLYNAVNKNSEANCSTDNVYNTRCNEDTYNHLDEVLNNNTPVENIYNEASGKV